MIALAVLLVAPALAQDAVPAASAPTWLDRANALRARVQAREEGAVSELRAFLAELRAAELDRGEGSRDLLALLRATYDLGTYDDEASLDERCALLHDSRAVSKEFGDEECEARAVWSQARLLLAAGRLAAARDALREALDALPGAWRSRTHMLLLLAEAQRQLGEYESALAALDEAESGVPEGQAWDAVRWSIPGRRAQVWLDLGLPDQAAPAIAAEQAIAEVVRARGLRDAALVRNADARRVGLALLQGDFERAIALADGALADEELYAEQPPARAQLQLMAGIASARLEAQSPTRTPRAEVLLTSALDMAGVPERVAFEGELWLAWLLLRDGRLDEARERADAAAERIASWRTAEALPPRLEEAQLATMRARLALESDASRDELIAAREQLVSAYGAFLELWSRVPRRAGGTGYLDDLDRAAVLSELLRLEVHLEGPEEGAVGAFAHVGRAEVLASLSRRLGARAPGVEALRAGLLGPDHGLLLYLPARERVHCLLLDDETALALDLGASTDIDAYQRRFMALLLAPPPMEADRRSARAADLNDLGRQTAALVLPGAVRDALSRWSAVTVVSCGWMSALPFECLPLDGRPLGRTIAIDALPSTAAGLALANRARPEDDGSGELDFVLVAEPSPSEETIAKWPRVGPLPLGANERETLLSAYPAGRTRAHLADGATAAALRLPEVARALVLQLLVHGIVDSTRERPAGLVLSAESATDDGVLWAEDLDELVSMPRLVVLTSCGSGRAPLRNGDEGAATLWAPLLAAGADAVVHARGDLLFEPTIRLSQTLNRRLAAGDSPAEALRAARAELASDDRWNDPFFDGLVQVVGLGHRPVVDATHAASERRGRTTAWAGTALVAVAVAVAGAFALARRRARERA